MVADEVRHLSADTPALPSARITGSGQPSPRRGSARHRAGPHHRRGRRAAPAGGQLRQTTLTVREMARSTAVIALQGADNARVRSTGWRASPPSSGRISQHARQGSRLSVQVSEHIHHQAQQIPRILRARPDNPGPGTHQTRGAFPVYLPAVRPCRNPSPDTPRHVFTGAMTVASSIQSPRLPHPFTSLVPCLSGRRLTLTTVGIPARPIFL